MIVDFSSITSIYCDKNRYGLPHIQDIQLLNYLNFHCAQPISTVKITENVKKLTFIVLHVRIKYCHLSLANSSHICALTEYTQYGAGLA